MCKRTHKPRRRYRFCKRLFEIFTSAIAILILSPLLLIVLLINTIVLKGFPIYKDPRVGKDGKDIHVYKFRSMYIDAESNIKRYLNRKQMKQWKEERKVDNDPRITKFGKFLRKSSIDELPQLFNILFGSMSIVGPRPITRMELDAHFTPNQQKLLLSSRPGLISNWGVNGRNNITFESGERQKLELEYYYKRGIRYDLKLMFKVIPTVLSGKGAK